MVSTCTHLSYDVRLRRARTSATLRYHRRKAATTWFWTWAHARWGKQPYLATKVRWGLVRDVPALRTFRPRHDHLCYEDILHLEDQSYILLTRLTVMTKHA